MDESWLEFFNNEREKEYFQELEKKIEQDREKWGSHRIFPKDITNIYRVFRIPINDIRVVILGQDPYHGINQANGYAFAVNKDVKIPPSLRNIMKEFKMDPDNPKNRTLKHWAKQGVFLINASLTVLQENPGSHSDYGWHTFTDNVIKYLNKERTGIVYCLWGRHAQKKKELIDLENNHLIECSHPSPFSANKTKEPFIGSGCADRINKLVSGDKIKWSR